MVPAYRIQTSAAITPTRRVYRDRLGREVRTEVASFQGTDVIRQDTYYVSVQTRTLLFGQCDI